MPWLHVAMITYSCAAAEVVVVVTVDATVLLEGVTEAALLVGAVAAAGNCTVALTTGSEAKFTMFVSGGVAARPRESP